VLKIGIGKK